MFGASDTTQTSNDDPAMLDNVKQLVNDPVGQAVTDQPQYMSASTQQPDPSFTLPTAPQTPAADAGLSEDTHPAAIAEPAQGFSSSPMPDPVTPMQSQMSQVDTTADTTTDAPISAAPIAPVDPEHLAGMKQQALDHLEPLVEHLDQSPEEAFKTTMMMIQANDNHTLLEKALDEAKKIEDDKTRANALLDIINEINYFSQATQE